jgi:asparagine synthase (glutamine-hydrolysing)
MCGVAGLIFTRFEHTQGDLICKLLRLLEHRGPDDHGWLVADRAGVQLGRGAVGDIEANAILIHRRLSIIDLSVAGWQPMSSSDGRYHIVFNGEIYNYRELRAELEVLGYTFRSKSDTEVLLNAFSQWGPRSLDRFVGMFAFAILDMRARRLFLARDFFGVKPLYYTLWRDGFAFASEIKALLELPGVDRQVNAQRLYDYLRFGLSGHGAATLFANVQQLPASHYLEVSLDTAQINGPVRYWQPDLSHKACLSFDEAAAQLRDLFMESTCLHLRSDVPLGVALSGGIDSSAIIMAMRYMQPDLDLHSFSYVADDPQINEEAWVDKVSAAAKSIVHKVRLQPHELLHDLRHMIYFQDEPFGSTSIYAQHQVFRLAHESGVKVMLDGQGADEYLGGYIAYAPARLASLIKQRRWGEALRFWHNASRRLGTGKVWLWMGQFLLPPSVQSPFRYLVDQTLLPAWLNGIWFAERGVIPRPPAAPCGREVLREELYSTLTETSLPSLLRYEDRNSMAFSIESRVPFLTPALVNFVLTLPEEYIIAADSTSKAVFRRAMRGIVPDSVLDRRDKIGFATPELHWMTSLSPWIEATLHSEAARLPMLNLDAMRREWQAILDGRKRFSFRVWRWINLILWAEQYRVIFE